MHSNMPTELENVYLYLRKSREDREAEERAKREGREEIETLSRHRRQLLELAHRHRHNITHILEEVVSGEFISERPQVQQLLRDVDAGEVTAVWVMDIDRLGRGDMADQGAILRTFKESDTLILTPDKVYDLSDEMDEEWTEFKTFFARRELKMITKRMQRGRIASVQEGKFIGTKPPYGYDVTPRLTLVPNEHADVVRTIFDLYTHRGLGCHRIASYLNSLGISSPGGKRWRGEGVIALLGNPVYAGWITWRRTYQDKRRGIAHKRPEEEWIKSRGRHDPLVDEITFERAKVIRTQRTHASVRSDRTPSSPLSGIVRCAKCGETMVKRTYTRQAAHLICKNPNCDTRSTRLALVESKVLESLTDWLEGYQLTLSDVATAMNEPASPALDLEKKLAGLDKELERVNLQRNRLHNLLEQGIYDGTIYLERNQKLMTELTDLQNQRSRVEHEVHKSQELRRAPFTAIPRITHVLNAYEITEDIAKRNRLLKSVLARVIYHKEKWQVRDNFELELYPLV